MIKNGDLQTGILLGLGLGFVARDILVANDSLIKTFFAALIRKGSRMLDPETQSPPFPVTGHGSQGTAGKAVGRRRKSSLLTPDVPVRRPRMQGA